MSAGRSAAPKSEHRESARNGVALPPGGREQLVILCERCMSSGACAPPALALSLARTRAACLLRRSERAQTMARQTSCHSVVQVVPTFIPFIPLFSSLYVPPHLCNDRSGASGRGGFLARTSTSTTHSASYALHPVRVCNGQWGGDGRPVVCLFQPSGHWPCSRLATGHAARSMVQ